MHSPERTFLARAGAILCLLVLAAMLAPGCDHGLGPFPDDAVAGFSGVIYFKNWPVADSVKELRLLVFPKYPADSSSIVLALLTGGVVVYPPIGSTGMAKFTDSLHYRITTKSTTLKVGKYDYLVLGWRYGNNFFSDWRPAGVYSQAGTFDPSPVRVLLHRVTPGIDIYVDFSKPPPRPWR